MDNPNNLPEHGFRRGDIVVWTDSRGPWRGEVLQLLDPQVRGGLVYDLEVRPLDGFRDYAPRAVPSAICRKIIGW